MFLTLSVESFPPRRQTQYWILGTEGMADVSAMGRDAVKHRIKVDGMMPGRTTSHARGTSPVQPGRWQP